MYDLVIKNAQIIDGQGTKQFKSCIGIKENRITRIGTIQDNEAYGLLDAEDNIVCPGFIDVNNHSDTYLTLFTIPQLTSLITQGITTIIGGNCGSSLAPLVDGKAIESIQKWVNINQVNVNWLTIQELFAVLTKGGLSLNFGTLVGYQTVRRGMLKDESRPLTEQELRSIQGLIETALDQGALGVSIGLAFSHMHMADMMELKRVASLVAKKDKILTIHLRDEGEGIIQSLIEALIIAKETGVKLHISHLKILGEKNWPLLDSVLTLLANAQKEGVYVTFDVFPYTANNSVLYIVLPIWACQGGREAMLNRLQDKQERIAIIEEMQANNYDYNTITIASSAPENFIGKSILEIARNQGSSVEEALLNVIIASRGRALIFNYSINIKSLTSFMAHPLSIISSDGAGYDTDLASSYTFNQGLVHPRCFGAFPLYLSRYVLPSRGQSLEQGIHKITGFPAQKFNIKYRGVLKEGNYADIVVLNKKRLHSTANFKNPFRYATGIDNVIINGKVVVDDGKVQHIASGTIITSP